MNLLNKLLPSFNPPQIVISLSTTLIWWNNSTYSSYIFYNIFSTINVINSIISFISTFLYLQCLCISLGVRDKLYIGTLKCSLVRTFINCKLSDNKDIELVRLIKFYELCALRRGSKEELLRTIIQKVWKACGSFWYLKSSTKL